MKIRVLTRPCPASIYTHAKLIEISDNFAPVMEVHYEGNITPELQKLYKAFWIEVTNEVKPEKLVAVLGVFD